MLQNRTLSHRMVILLAALVLALLTTGTVLAQATANYDLGCRGVFASGSGTIIHGTTGSVGLLGQWTAGTTTTAGAGIRSGFVLPASAQSSQSRAVAPAATDQLTDIFLPFVQNAIQLVRGCQY